MPVGRAARGKVVSAMRLAAVARKVFNVSVRTGKGCAFDNYCAFLGKARAANPVPRAFRRNGCSMSRGRHPRACPAQRRSGMTDISKAGTYRLGDREVKRMGYGAMQLAGPGVYG